MRLGFFLRKDVRQTDVLKQITLSVVARTDAIIYILTVTKILLQ